MSSKATSAASKVLRSKGASKAAKSAAGSALSQTKTPNKVTSSEAIQIFTIAKKETQ